MGSPFPSHMGGAVPREGSAASVYAAELLLAVDALIYRGL